MELRHLRYFLVLAEELHFGNAAKRLFISQPPLSRQIKELEEELAVDLFVRDNKRVMMTEAGHYFVQEAQDILNRLKVAREHVSQIHRSLAGEIKIAYISSTDKKKLGQLVQALQHEHPFLQTKLYEMSSEHQAEALVNGAIDVGIVRAPLLSPTLKAEKLYEDGFSLALPRAMSVSDDLAALADEPFISYHADYAPIYHGQMLAFCAGIGFAPKLRHACNTISSILELVHIGAGISVVPQSVQSQYQHLHINFLNLGEASIKTDILLAYTKQQGHPAFGALQTLIKNIFST